VIAERYIYNTEHATKTYAGITLTAYQDDSVTDMKYALDESGQPGTWLDSITLPDGDYATPYKGWVKCIFAPTSEPIKKTTVKHWIRAEQETLKGARSSLQGQPLTVESTAARMVGSRGVLCNSLDRNSMCGRSHTLA